MASAKSSALSQFRMIAYTLGIAFVLGAFVYGWSYYSLPLVERPQSPLHVALKPGGEWGHGFGVVGSAMILLLFLYSARKRKLFGLRWGATRRWLSVHIFFGVMGPLLVTLHTALKFNGIVSIGYYAMATVALSGIFGRYIYIQIPRTASGAELQLQDLEDQERELEKELADRHNLSGDVLIQLDRLTESSAVTGDNGFWATIKNDLTRINSRKRITRFIRQLLGNISEDAISDITDMTLRKALLHRRIAYLATFKKLFHYWHVFHKPFAYIMVIVVLIHVTVALLFGYRWVF